MITVKISYPENNSDFLMKMLPKSGYSNDIVYILNPPSDNTKYDYWLVFNFLPGYFDQQTNCPKENTIFIAIEPLSVKIYPKAFLKQFAHIISFQGYILNHFSNAVLSPPLSEWFVGKSHDELAKIDFVPKSRNISIISSNKINLPGQQKRLYFALKLKEVFKDKIDLYGRGIQPFDDKWDVLSPYKYSIAIENSFTNNYFTEKINDCFLAHTLPIYYGCPNLENYFDAESYKRIDINDFNRSKLVIEELVDDPHYYDNKLNSILNSKKRILNKYNLFAFVSEFILSLENGNNNILNPVVIKQKMSYTSEYVSEMFIYKLRKRLKII
ncbi:MAG: glycosyltransferase family 10 [Paludibacter sp.]|nr:glycosyltransferase family 10 [Paludibacter sp.]